MLETNSCNKIFSLLDGFLVLSGLCIFFRVFKLRKRKLEAVKQEKIHKDMQEISGKSREMRAKIINEEKKLITYLEQVPDLKNWTFEKTEEIKGKIKEFLDFLEKEDSLIKYTESPEKGNILQGLKILKQFSLANVEDCIRETQNKTKVKLEFIEKALRLFQQYAPMDVPAELLKSLSKEYPRFSRVIPANKFSGSEKVTEVDADEVLAQAGPDLVSPEARAIIVKI